MTGEAQAMTSRRGWRMTARRASLAVVVLVALTACGRGGGTASSGNNSICSLAEQADAAVLSGEGPYAGKETELASAFRKASIPKGDPEDVALLTRLRSETATSIDAVARVPKGDAVALDRAQGAVEGNLADITGNDLCAGTVQPGPTRPTTTVRPCPTQSIKMGQISGWTKLKDDYQIDTWNASTTLTNPNNVPFRLSESTAIINYTGGRVPAALIGDFNAFEPSAGSKAGLLKPLVLPGQTIRVTLEAVAGQQVTGITTSEVFASGHFVFADADGCPGTIEGIKPFDQAPQARRALDDTDPRRTLPKCGVANSSLLCA